MQDLVSVIIPVYNTEQYLDRCLESVFAQSYHNLEVIIVNDASPDNADRVACDWAGKHANIKYIKLAQNGGLSNARNVGLDNMSGDWILFLDSDDTIKPETVDTLLQHSGGADAVAFSFYRIRGNREFSQNVRLAEKTYDRKTLCRGLFQTYSLSWLSCVGTKLYRAKAVQERQIRFTDKYKYNEDLGFIVDFLSEANQIAVVERELYGYYYTPGSTQHQKAYRPGSLESASAAREALRAFLTGEGLWEQKKNGFGAAMTEMYFGSMLCRWRSQREFDHVYQFVRDHKEYIESGYPLCSGPVRVFSRLILRDHKRMVYSYMAALREFRAIKNRRLNPGER